MMGALEFMHWQRQQAFKTIEMEADMDRKVLETSLKAGILTGPEVVHRLAALSEQVRHKKDEIIKQIRLC
jgi:hypothetical protein